MTPTQRILDAWPRDWRDLLTDSPTSIGMDVATTTKKTSNPSSITLMQKVGTDFLARVIVRFKTSNDEVMMAMLANALDIPRGRMRRICIDATSERFFAGRCKRHFAGQAVVEPVVGSENIEHLGQVMNYKLYLGNLLVNTIEDGRLVLPCENWVRDDFRLVKRDQGTFIADIDEHGNHGDSFDSTKLALHGLVSGGRAEAEAVDTAGSASPPRAGLLTKFRRLLAGDDTRKTNL